VRRTCSLPLEMADDNGTMYVKKVANKNPTSDGKCSLTSADILKHSPTFQLPCRSTYSSPTTSPSSAPANVMSHSVAYKLVLLILSFRGLGPTEMSIRSSSPRWQCTCRSRRFLQAGCLDGLTGPGKGDPQSKAENDQLTQRRVACLL
jgi:hypothetical protein